MRPVGDRVTAMAVQRGRRFDQSSSHVNIGNSRIALETVERMRTIINSFKKNKAADLIELMRYTDEELRCGMPFGKVCGCRVGVRPSLGLRLVCVQA